MSDALKSKELLRRYSIARIPFVAINTIERGRALSILKEISDDLNLPFYVHTLSRGLYDLVTDKSINSDKSVYGAIDFMSEQMKRKQNPRISAMIHLISSRFQIWLHWLLNQAAL